MSVTNDVPRFAALVEKVHQVVNGDSETVVETESGPVRSLAKLIDDKDQEFQRTGVIGDINAIKDEAVTAAAVAAAAADVAMNVDNLYADIAAGIADTSVGDYFCVPSSLSKESFVLYLHSAGGVPTEVKRQPSNVAVMDVDRQQMRYTANGKRVDNFTSSFPISVTRFETGSGLNATATRRAGGGLDSNATVGAAHYLISTPYIRAGGVDDLWLEAEIVASDSASHGFGIGFGDVPAERVVLMYYSSGALRLIDYSGNQIVALRGSSPATVYAPGDKVAIGVTFYPDDTGVARIKRPDGEIEQYAFDVPRSGSIHIVHRPQGSIFFPALVVDGMSELQYAVASRQEIDIFPDPAFQGISAGPNWIGSTTLEDGEHVRVMPGDASQVSSWLLDAIGDLRPGSTIRLRYDVNPDVTSSAALRAQFTFQTHLGQQISVAAAPSSATGGTWQRGEVSTLVPENAGRILIWLGGRNGATVTKFRRVRLFSDRSQLRQTGVAPSIIQDRRVFVGPTGSDGNSGTEGSPLATMDAALQHERLSGGGDIVLLQGDIRAPSVPLTPFAAKGPISIQSRYDQRGRIFNNLEIGAITKTAGQIKVYQASCEAEPPRYIWEHGVEDERTLIPLTERLHLQRGRRCRLPSTRLRKAASVAAIDAADDDDPCWYWNEGTLYFSVFGGGDGTAADIRIPGGHAISGGNGVQLEIIGVDVWYGSVFTNNAARHIMRDVFILGSGANADAVVFDSCNWFEAHQCEMAGSLNDGLNAHNHGSPSLRETVARHFDIWSHDNYGDGHSEHENARFVVHGGLYEYNGKAGIVPAGGCHAAAYGTHARRNGFNTNSGGGGFAITNANTSSDLGVGTQFDLIDCISEDNFYNYMCGPSGGSGGTTNPEHTMRIYRGISRNGIVAGYYARVGRIEATDCRDLGSTADRLTADAGSIVVVTTNPLS